MKSKICQLCLDFQPCDIWVGWRWISLLPTTMFYLNLASNNSTEPTKNLLKPSTKLIIIQKSNDWPNVFKWELRGWVFRVVPKNFNKLFALYLYSIILVQLQWWSIKTPNRELLVWTGTIPTITNKEAGERLYAELLTGVLDCAVRMHVWPMLSMHVCRWCHLHACADDVIRTNTIRMQMMSSMQSLSTCGNAEDCETTNEHY